MSTITSWNRKTLLSALKPSPDYYVEIGWKENGGTGALEREFFLVTPTDKPGAQSRRKLPSSLVTDLLWKVAFRQEADRIYFRPWLPPREGVTADADTEQPAALPAR